jgi:hypothetical protein
VSATAAVAPLFLSNDQRGYLQTAMVTTPVIFAGAAMAPQLFNRTKRETAAVFKAISLGASSVRFSGPVPTYSEVTSLFSNTAASTSTIEQAVASYVSSFEKTRDLEQERQALKNYFLRKYFVSPENLAAEMDMTDPEKSLRALLNNNIIRAEMDSKRRLVSNAINAARRSSLKPSEWAQERNPARYSEMGDEELQAMFDKFSDRPDFLRNFNAHLRHIEGLDGLSSTAPSEVISGVDVESMLAPPEALDFEFPSKVQQDFLKSNESFATNLRRAMKEQHLQEIRTISTKVLSGETGRVIAVQLHRRGGTIELPIPDAEGLVRFGADAGYVGVARHVIGPDRQRRRIHEWVAEKIAESGGYSLKQLEQEISSGVNYVAADPRDSFFRAQLEASGSVPVYYPEAAKVRAQSAFITDLPVFNGNTFRQLEPENKTKFITGLINSGEYVAMGSESGVYEGVLQVKNLANLSAFGVPSVEKQDDVYRFITKGFRLGHRGNLNASLRPRYSTTAYQDILGTMNLPEATLITHGLTPQDKSLFADLPRTLEALQANSQSIMQKFDARMPTSEAIAMYGEIENLYREGRQGAFQQLGRIGETEFLVSNKWADNFFVESKYRYQVADLAIKGGMVTPGTTLGFLHGVPVSPAFGGEIESIARTTEEGQTDLWDIVVRHENPINGAKIDVHGVKGQAYVAGTEQQFEDARNILNSFYHRVGSADYISDAVNAFTDVHYFQNKITNPITGELALGADITSTLDRVGATAVTAGYKEKLAQFGVGYDEGQFIVNHELLPSKWADKVAHIQQISDINNEFFAKASEAITRAKGYGDAGLKRFAAMNAGDISTWWLKNQFPGLARAWDHSLAYIPRHVSLTHDFESFMLLSGKIAGLREIQGRAEILSGDRNMALDFFKNLKGDFMSPFGGPVVELNKAFRNTGSLTRASIRAGSVLDPGIESYKNNFTIDLGMGGKYRYLPVPGTDAAGSVSHLFAPGEYETHDWQRALQNVWTNAGDPNKRDAAVEELLSTYERELYVGKTGALRPRQFDPQAMPGFLQTRSSPNDPFEIGINPEDIGRIPDKATREAVKDGRDVYAVLSRQPISGLFYHKVVLDENLRGTAGIGTDEAIRAVLGADADKDPGGLHFLRPGSDAAREAEAIYGSQIDQLNSFRSIKGYADESRMVSEDVVGLSDRVRGFLAKASDPAKAIENRMAGGAIGNLSNTLTEVIENMVRNPILMRDPATTSRLATNFYENIRQVSINARKAHVKFDLEEAVKYNERLKEALRMQDPLDSAETTRSIMLDLAQKMGNKTQEYLASEQAGKDFLAYSSGRRREASIMASALTADPRTPEAMSAAQRNLGRLFEDLSTTLGPAHGGGNFATASAQTIGEMNASTRTTEAAGGLATEARIATKSLLNKHGTSLAIAAGAAALGGLLLVKPSFDRPSGNRLRPENNIAGMDMMPGEPIEGSRSGQPSRRELPPMPQVNTATVVPVNQTNSLEVRMKAHDRAAGAEIAKLAGRMSSTGNQNLTINYRSSKFNSLRMKERIKEIRDEG